MVFFFPLVGCCLLQSGIILIFYTCCALSDLPSIFFSPFPLFSTSGKVGELKQARGKESFARRLSLRKHNLHAMHMSITAKTRYDIFLCPGIVFAHSTIFPPSISPLSKVVIPQGILEHRFLLCFIKWP